MDPERIRGAQGHLRGIQRLLAAMVQEEDDRAEARQPHVSLEHPEIGLVAFPSILKIEPGTTPDSSTRVTYTTTGTWLPVLESPAEITHLAREAWGEDWSCPGAEPPVVVLHDAERPYPYRSIERIESSGGKNLVVGDWWPSAVKRWSTNRRAKTVDESPAEVRQLCAKAGVPCPPEEPPKEELTVLLTNQHGESVTVPTCYTEMMLTEANGLAATRIHTAKGTWVVREGPDRIHRLIAEARGEQP